MHKRNTINYPRVKVCLFINHAMGHVFIRLQLFIVHHNKFQLGPQWINKLYISLFRSLTSLELTSSLTLDITKSRRLFFLNKPSQARPNTRQIETSTLHGYTEAPTKLEKQNFRALWILYDGCKSRWIVNFASTPRPDEKGSDPFCAEMDINVRCHYLNSVEGGNEFEDEVSSRAESALFWTKNHQFNYWSILVACKLRWSEHQVNCHWIVFVLSE